MNAGKNKTLITVVVVILSLGLVATYVPLFFAPQPAAQSTPVPSAEPPVAESPSGTPAAAGPSATSTSPSAPVAAPLPEPTTPPPTPQPITGGQSLQGLDQLLQGGK